MSVQALYQETILQHSRHPRRFGRLRHATHSAAGDNPLCGDRLLLDLEVGRDLRVVDAAFEGVGCAVSIASASLLVDRLPGLDLDGAAELARAVDVLLGRGAAECPASLGEIDALGAVRSFPARVACASLAWETLREALGRCSGGLTK